MARFTYEGQTVEASGLAYMTRDDIRGIVMAGADAAVERMKQRIRIMHRINGDMEEGVEATEYRETLGGGYASVYPQGTDRKGASNTIKAYVINYGRGRTRRPKGKPSRAKTNFGDHFISDDPEVERIVQEAMEEEFDRRMVARGLAG